MNKKILEINKKISDAVETVFSILAFILMVVFGLICIALSVMLLKIIIVNIPLYPNQAVKPITNEPFVANHITWSAYGTPSFIVTDGKVTESASAVFTDPTKGSLTLEFKPTEPTCLIQFGGTEVFTSDFSATLVKGDFSTEFLVIAKSYWDRLPQSDGAYNLCWER